MKLGPQEIVQVPIPSDNAVEMTEDAAITLHPSLQELPKSIRRKLFRALTVADVEPDESKEILECWLESCLHPLKLQTHAFAEQWLLHRTQALNHLRAKGHGYPKGTARTHHPTPSCHATPTVDHLGWRKLAPSCSM